MTDVSNTDGWTGSVGDTCTIKQTGLGLSLTDISNWEIIAIQNQGGNTSFVISGITYHFANGLFVGTT